MSVAKQERTAFLHVCESLPSYGVKVADRRDHRSLLSKLQNVLLQSNLSKEFFTINYEILFCFLTEKQNFFVHCSCDFFDYTSAWFLTF